MGLHYCHYSEFPRHATSTGTASTLNLILSYNKVLVLVPLSLIKRSTESKGKVMGNLR